MKDYYTIRGRVTGKDYLVVVYPRRLAMYEPGTWTPPWRGVSGAQYGVSWQPAAAIHFGEPLWWAELRMRWLIERIEQRARRDRRRVARAKRFAERRKP